MRESIVSAALEARLIAFNLFLEGLGGGEETREHGQVGLSIAQATDALLQNPDTRAEVRTRLESLSRGELEPAG
jgi:hypothetical protein